MFRYWKRNGVAGSLQGWRQIAKCLGQPVSLAQRWAKAEMPVIRKVG